jgi:hypothetical protein
MREQFMIEMSSRESSLSVKRKGPQMKKDCLHSISPGDIPAPLWRLETAAVVENPAQQGFQSKRGQCVYVREDLKFQQY